METQIQNHVARVPEDSSEWKNSTKLSVMKRRSQWQFPDFHCLDSINRSLITTSGRIELAVTERNNRIRRKADVIAVANSFREPVILIPKLSETVKGKLSLGARILQVGGMRKVFKYLFTVGEKERLIKVLQCYLSTTAGPIAGILFILTQKVDFCSERTIKLSCTNGKSIRVHYKVAIPLAKIQSVNQSENMKRPSQKYLQIVTEDDFDFCFMGFLNYEKSFEYFRRVIYQPVESVKIL